MGRTVQLAGSEAVAVWIMIDGDLRYTIVHLDAPLVKRHYHSFLGPQGELTSVLVRKSWDASIMTDEPLAFLLEKLLKSVGVKFGRGDITIARGKGIITSIKDSADEHHIVIYGDGPLESCYETNTN
jgi:hypothetical protein